MMFTRTSSHGPESFDISFYRKRYPDIRHLSKRAAFQHFKKFGRKEGRLPNAHSGEFDESVLAALPTGFSVKGYLILNPDLMVLGLAESEVMNHYVESGALEGRPYNCFNPSVYRELYFSGQSLSDDYLWSHYANVGRELGSIGSAAEYLATKGCKDAFWADAIKLEEFRLLNWSWAGPLGRYLDAVDAMIREGTARLAPISFDLEFDADYYREAYPNLADASDQLAYRHWLWEAGVKVPGSPLAHLKSLSLALQSYPPSFRWREYASKGGMLVGRWGALDHLVRRGVPDGVSPPVKGEGASAFLVALSQTIALRDDRVAIGLLEAAREHAPLEAFALQWLGDCHLRLENWSAAYDAYAQVASMAEPVVWTFVNGARAALRAERTSEALDLLLAGKATFSGEQIWRASVKEAIQAEFADSWREAEALYLDGERGRGDRLMTQAVQNAAERWNTLEPLGAPLPPHPDGRVVMLANVDLRQCTHYRVDQKVELFEALGRPYAIFTQAQVADFMTALVGASSAIFYRLPATPENVRAIQIARAMGVPTYYDIDDLIFDPEAYPEPFETYGGVTKEFHSMLQLGVPLFRGAMAMCDYGIASTTSLARHMESVVRSGKVYVLPNGLDGKNQHYIAQPPNRTRRDGEIVIFYGSGTKAHNSDFNDLAGRALSMVMRRDSNVRLVLVGYLELSSDFNDLRAQVTSIDWIPDVSAYWSLLVEADINIAVLANQATTNAKSEIKWIEAAVLGLPSIVSATDTYREVLTDGVDALIASDVEEWVEALERLIADAELRQALVREAQQKLLREYSVERNAVRLSHILPRMPQSAQPKCKKRVLLVNLFFPPQTIGGSTRVTKDNLDYFQQNVSDEFEFAVVTTDNDAPIRNRIQVEDYGGSPVFRISTPLEANLEWRPSNPEIKLIFLDILGIWKPDVVHFHCVQRLSASIVEACRELGIPYINTVHDAFWISDYQFLTDQKDQLRAPGESWPLEPPPPISVGASLARRRYLQPLLQDSAEILGVSRSFTRLYQDCGFERAVCVANGVPPMPCVSRTRSATGRVRLAHVGSQTYFKGYHHIQAALKQNAFRNLELTIIEHSRTGGEVNTTTWGATSVRKVGKTKLEQMQDFYANIDVLLAPSLWPESFGLVSREALRAGLWVLASNRGAIGEDVTPGLNGWVVDVSTPEGVIAALGEMNDDPERFMVPPPQSKVPLRTADDQAGDLIEIYRDVISRPNLEPQKFPSGQRPLKARWSLDALRQAEFERAPNIP